MVAHNKPVSSMFLSVHRLTHTHTHKEELWAYSIHICQRNLRHSDQCLHKPRHLFSILEEIWIDSTPKVTTGGMCWHTVKAFLCHSGNGTMITQAFKTGPECGGQSLLFFGDWKPMDTFWWESWKGSFEVKLLASHPSMKSQLLVISRSSQFESG